MDAGDERHLADRLERALRTAGLELVSAHFTAANRKEVRAANLVSAIGWLFKGNYVLREAGAATPPSQPARLIAFPGRDRG